MTNEEFVAEYSGSPLDGDDLTHLAAMKCEGSIGFLAAASLDAGAEFIAELDKFDFVIG